MMKSYSELLADAKLRLTVSKITAELTKGGAEYSTDRSSRKKRLLPAAEDARRDVCSSAVFNGMSLL
jgi:hypothetical protein